MGQGSSTEYLNEMEGGVSRDDDDNQSIGSGISDVSEDHDVRSKRIWIGYIPIVIVAGLSLTLYIFYVKFWLSADQ